MQDIYIGDEGKGFPLVLIHGFLGSSIMWRPQIDFFKDYFRVITPDLPGFGKSNKAKSHNSIQSIANLLLDCLEEKKIDKFYLLGHSMGGMIVQEMAKKGGDKISKLVCYSTGPRGEMPGRFETIDKLEKTLKSFVKKNNLNNSVFKDLSTIKNLLKINSKTIFSTNFGRDIEYYTGIVFEIYNSSKKEIARGGRYDGLLKSLGSKKNISAVGAAINLNNLQT